MESPDGRHEADHDLESFFWVLLWVVLRHTRHTFSAPDEHLRYTALFGADPATVDVDVNAEFGERKRDYLLGFINVITCNNRPLSVLLHDFRLLCGRNIDGPVESRRDMNHDDVLDIFDRALARDGWSKSGDGPRPFVDRRETRPGSAAEVESGTRSGSKKRKRDTAVIAKRPQAEAGARPQKRAKARR